MISLSIRQATPFVGQKPGKKPRTPKQIAQAIRYSLTKKPGDWEAIGVDPSSVKYGVDDDYTKEIAIAMRWPTPERLEELAGAKLKIANSVVRAGASVANTVREVSHDLSGAKLENGGVHSDRPLVLSGDELPEVVIKRKPKSIYKDPPPPPPPPVMPKPRGYREPKPKTTLSESLGSDGMKKTILFTVLVADFVATGINYWTTLADKPDGIRIVSALVFGFVAIIVGLAGFVNYVKVKDESTANAFAFFFGIYQLVIHGVTLAPDWAFIGCGAVIAGLVLVPSAVLTVIREEAQ